MRTDDELTQVCTDVWLKTIGDGQEQANMATARAMYELGRTDATTWVPVSERLPEPNSGYVLGLMPNGRCWITWLNEEGRWSAMDKSYGPTHWMPLPAAPLGG
jgi:hypothetical protein